MVDLPGPVTHAEPLVTSEAPQSRVSGAEVAQPYAMLGQSLDKLGEGLGSVAEPLAEKAGLDAVTTDDQGNLHVAKMPVFGEAGKVYARAVKYSALAQGEAEAQRQDLLLSKQFPNDPQGYLTASQAFREKIVQQYNQEAGPEVGLALGRAIDAKTTYNYRYLLLQQQHTIKENFNKDTLSVINRNADEVDSLIAAGALETPEGKKAVNDRIRTIDTVAHERVHNPVLSAAPEDTANQVQQLRERFGASEFVYQVNKTLNAKDGGPYKAMDAVEAQLQRKDISATQAQLNYVHGLAAIKDWHDNNTRVTGIANAQQKQRDQLWEDAVIRDHASDKPAITEFDIKTAEGISPESRMRMLRWVKSDGMPEPLSRVSQATTTNALRRMNLPDDDPNKITSTSQIIDLMAPPDGSPSRLKREDGDWLIKQLKEGLTPEGNQINQLKAQVVKSSGLDRSSMMKADDTGKQAEYAYARYVDMRVDQMRKAGKSPAEIYSTLFNPNNKDFIGSPEIVGYFRSTLEERTKRVQQNITGSRPPPPPGLEGAPPPETAKPVRKPGESISDFDKRTGIR